MAKVTLLQGDSLTLLPTLKPNSVDAIITDPPYSSGGQFRGDRMGSTTSKYQLTNSAKKYEDFSGDNRDQRAWTMWSGLWLSAALEALKPGGVVLAFSDWRMLPATTDALQVAGLVWRGISVWDKTGAARPVLGRFKNQAKYMVWASNGPMPLNRLDGQPVRCLPGVFTLPVVSAEKQHLTGKPIRLMTELVKIVKPGSTILDPFMGSGTTGVAAIAHGCDFIGIEQNQTYFDLSKKLITAQQKTTRKK